MVTTSETVGAKEAYSRLTARKVLFILVGLGGLVALALVATSLGSADLGVNSVASAIAARAWVSFTLPVA